MTTSKYLDSILKILPAVQAKQITNLLEEFKATGAVKNAQEYQRKLNELAILINDVNPKPSFQAIQGLAWHLIGSEAHNVMMRSLKNDIEASFMQVDEMGKKTDDHHNLVLKNMISDLERGLDHQNNLIRNLEWLRDGNNEFTLALVNSFSSVTPMNVSYSEFGSERFYYNNRTYKALTSIKDIFFAKVDRHGQKLILDTTKDSLIAPVSAKLIHDSISYGTSQIVDIDNNIEDIIDGLLGTFWTRNIYLKDNVEKVSTVIEFSLGNARNITFVKFEGGTEAPFTIEEIKGVSPDGHFINIMTTPTEVNGKARIDFDKVLVKSVIVNFSVNTYDKVEYFVEKDSLSNDLYSSGFKNFTNSEKTEAITPVVNELISPSMSESLNLTNNHSQEQINHFLYSFTLDNVWFGDSTFNDSGIFVSKPLSGDDFGVIAVATQEDVGADTPNHSIEYEIIKIDTFPKPREKKFPILPINTSSVLHERLILTRKDNNNTNNSTKLRFCPYIDPDWTTLSDFPVKIYKNGIELNLGNDGWVYSISEEVSWKEIFSYSTSFSNFTLSPSGMLIKINNPDSSAVYTASYTPRTSDTYITDDTIWLDKEETVYIGSNGRIYIKREDFDNSVSSEVYLQITLRRNTPEAFKGPELNEYALLAATYR